MKKLLNLFIFLITLSSCEKEIFYIECDTTYPTTQDSASFIPLGELEGKWLLKDAVMYVTNLDINVTDSIFLFMSSTTNSLRYGGSYYEFEDVSLDETTWLFNYPPNTPGIGSFILDGDSITPYGLNVTHNNITVLENMLGPQQMGGASRPIHYKMLNPQNTLVLIEVQHTYENINGYNSYYYTKLKFKKQ
tara:strand:- start:474 stop:1046 length:573 start_codon:yes stop_codon:yes gene_type:complete